MKHSWLLFGFVLLLLQWINTTYIKIVILFIVFFYYRKHYAIHILGILLFLIFGFSCILAKDIHKPISKTLHVKELRSNYLIASTGDEKVVVYGVDTASFDDIIEINGDYEYVDSIHNIRSFQFSKWLQRRDIYYQINAKNYKVIKKGTSIRNKLYHHIQSINNKEQRTWIKMMLYGIHDDEVSYFITSSGMHISYLFFLIETVLILFFSKELTTLFILLGIGSCGFVSVFSASLLRVLCFRGARFVCDKQASDDVLGISMCVTLWIFPYMAFELAFLLPVGFRIIQLFNIQRRKRKITAFCVLIPIQFMYFHVCNPIQILFFQYIRVVYAFLYALCWMMVFFPNVWLLSISLSIYHVLEIIGNMGFSLYYTPSFWWMFSWVYMVCRFISFQDTSKYTLCALLVYAPFASYLDPFGEIVMLDVGQGDCTIVKLPYHQGVMLIDVMGSLYKNVPKDIIVPTLKGMGIHSLDKVIITHQDYDHSGGLKELRELMPVKEVIQEKQESTTLGPLHIPFVIPEYVGSDENDNSILTYLDVYGLRILFMGDAGEAAENYLIEKYPKLKADIVKLGHHGSKTSSSLSFLHSVQPKLALISAGRGNRYGHPSEETMVRLEQEHIYPLISAKNGGVSIKFCKYFAFFRTADNEFGIIENR